MPSRIHGNCLTDSEAIAETPKLLRSKKNNLAFLGLVLGGFLSLLTVAFLVLERLS